jgi:hypothetical protein
VHCELPSGQPVTPLVAIPAYVAIGLGSFFEAVALLSVSWPRDHPSLRNGLRSSGFGQTKQLSLDLDLQGDASDLQMYFWPQAEWQKIRLR